MHINRNKKRKGQLFSADAIMAISLFILILSAVMLANSSVSNKINKSVIYRVMEQKAEFIEDYLMKNFSKTGAFDEEKVTSFFSKNYSEVNDDFDIGFNYSIEITYANSNQVFSLNGLALSIKRFQETRPNFLITAERTGFLKGEDVKLVTKVYYYE